MNLLKRDLLSMQFRLLKAPLAVWFSRFIDYNKVDSKCHVSLLKGITAKFNTAHIMDYMNFLEIELLEDMYDEDFEIGEFLEFGFPRRFNERPNYYEEMDDLNFLRRFRLTKLTVMHLLQEIEGQLEYPDNRNNSLSPMDQLLLALRFYASSGHLVQVADFMNVHVSSASRIVAHVSRVIAALRPQQVKMPIPTEHKQKIIFFNVQCLTDANLKFLDVVARWPGATHDSTIFANLTIRARFEAGQFPGCLIKGIVGIH
ncbi:unnamed protein product [Acanthoscelides obtectus]|uniref:Uncharacterized protein n=1 Tax=Acanthoscelides obtectus TaxID=200917 RepID=A0A9P0L161_ACAOB|nr:unnamed protein product [Acanthoscelides obtectus]CAK1681081.1 hypothetical protein AOBTE_LOCUS33008 [Acanthoscelides obtectus]